MTAAGGGLAATGSRAGDLRARASWLLRHDAMVFEAEAQALVALGSHTALAADQLTLQRGALVWSPAPSGVTVRAGRFRLDHGGGLHVSSYDMDARGRSLDGLHVRLAPLPLVEVEGVAAIARLGAGDAAVGIDTHSLVGVLAAFRPAPWLEGGLFMLAHGPGHAPLSVQSLGARTVLRGWQVVEAELEVAGQVGRAAPELEGATQHLGWTTALRVGAMSHGRWRLGAGVSWQHWSGARTGAAPGTSGWIPILPALDSVAGALQAIRPSALQVAGGWLRIALEDRADLILYGRSFGFHNDAKGIALDSWNVATGSFDGTLRVRVSPEADVRLIGAWRLPQRPAEAPPMPRGLTLLEVRARF